MKHQTFERFQGMWFGGIVGQALANQKHYREFNTRIKFPDQNWVWERKQIAEILLSNTEVEIKHLEHQLSQLRLLSKSNHLLLPTSCIFLPQEQQNLVLKDSRIKQEIVAWHYLIRLIMSSELQLDFALVIEQVRQQLDGKEDLLINKLQQIVVDVQNSISLHQLYEKLLPSEDNLKMAIALSWFCFISTPQDYKLSVLRATSIDSTIASMTTALTGTLSGAYNGITAIPGNWQRKIRFDSNYREVQAQRASTLKGINPHVSVVARRSTLDLENQVLLKLYKTWLGIHSINNNQELYNEKIDAVAGCQMIQPRKNLKIISQGSFRI